jgi:hypothetical protein
MDRTRRSCLRVLILSLLYIHVHNAHCRFHSVVTFAPASGAELCPSHKRDDALATEGAAIANARCDRADFRALPLDGLGNKAHDGIIELGLPAEDADRRL